MVTKRGPRRTGVPAVVRIDDDAAHLWDTELSDVARALLGSAVKCFTGKGFHATTTRDITSALGVTPGALYVHFESKEEVLFELIRIAHTRVLEELRSEMRGNDPGKYLHRLVARFVAWHAEYHEVGRIAQYELSPLRPDHYAQVLDQRNQINTIFRDAVRAQVDGGVFSEVDVNRTARAILSLGVDVVRWYRLDGRDSPAWLGEFYAELALKMCEIPPPPREPDANP